MPEKSSVESAKQQRARYLQEAARAVANAVKVGDTSSKRLWLRLAQAWSSMASEIPRDEY